MLTDRAITKLKATDGRLDVPDGKVPGLSLRVTPSGSKSWALRYRLGGGRAGRLRRITLGQYPVVGLATARRKATTVLRKVDAGDDPAEEKIESRRADTIEALAREYIERHAKPHKRSWREDSRMLDRDILPAWRHVKVQDLTRRNVRDLIDGIVDRGSPIAAVRTLALITTMLNFAVGRDWVDGNVAALLPKPAVAVSRDRVLTDDEIRLVWGMCATQRPAMCGLTRLRLVTAQRGGEVAKLKWSDIEGDWMTLPGAITKNKKSHRVPITKLARTILDTIPEVVGNDYIFAGRGATRPLTDERRGAARIRRRALAELQTTDPTIKVFDFRGHDLRRTAATRMAKAGVPRADIARVLNHTEGGPSATQVYDRYSYDKEKVVALETWERVLTGILNQSTRSSVVALASR